MEKSAIEKHIKWLEAQNSNTITCDWEAGYKAAIDRAREVAKIMAAEEKVKPTAPASLVEDLKKHIDFMEQECDCDCCLDVRELLTKILSRYQPAVSLA